MIAIAREDTEMTDLGETANTIETALASDPPMRGTTRMVASGSGMKTMATAFRVGETEVIVESAIDHKQAA